MVMDQLMNLMEKLINEIREAPPEKRNHFMKMTLGIVEMGIESFRANPDFRKGLARLVHKELQAYLEKD